MSGVGFWVRFLCAVTLCALGPYAASASDAPLIEGAPNPDRVLFIGNSFTYYNDSLHAQVRAIANDLDPGGRDERLFRALTISGARLDEHLLGARGLIEYGAQGERPRPWEIVVLQGHSRETWTEESTQRFARSAATLDTWVREAGAKTVLFMTWAYANDPKKISLIDRTYTRVGNRLAARVAPVGLAFARMRDERSDLALHAEDDMHPSPLGSYLAASVLYATLYGESPVGTNYTAGLDPAVAAVAQEVAWKTVQAYHAR